MAREIGRLHSFGIGLENTAGTVSVADYWLPLEEGDLKPIVKKVKDDSGLGIIDEFIDSHTTQLSSELTGKGIVRSKSIGTVIYGALGTEGATSTPEAGVTLHTFSRANTNNHPAFSVIHKDVTQEETTVYNMIDSVKFSFEVGTQGKFDLKTMGRQVANSTGATVSFVTLDEPFLVSNMTIKIASAVAGLAASSAIPVQSLNFEINKNLTQIFSSVGTGSALDFATQHNQQFSVNGDMELIYNEITYRDLAIANTKRAMSITIAGTTLIGATRFNQITFTFPSITLEDWTRSGGNNDIVMQNFGFSALYSTADTSTISSTLQNTVSGKYDV